jgi:hypothetical protein
VSVELYFDHNVSHDITDELRQREVNLITAAEDGRHDEADEALLVRSTALGRLFVTQDKDFLRITSAWSREGRSFAGVVYFAQRWVDMGRVIETLEAIAKVDDISEWQNRLDYVPF